ncbi:MAG: hypothetical protein V4721_10635 [Bacteroidota bacterium]
MEEKEWTPPTDAVVSEDKTEWTPPSDAVETAEKKKTLQSNSGSGTSVSTVEPWDYAARSISQIKSDNVKAVAKDKNDFAVAGLESALKDNKNPRYTQMVVESMVKKGFDADKMWEVANRVNPSPNTEAQLRKTIAKANPNTTEDEKVDWSVLDNVQHVINKHIVGSQEGIVEGGKQIAKGVNKIGGMPSMEEMTASEDGVPTLKSSGESMLVGLTDVGAGSGKSVFSAANLVAPPLIAFGVGVTALHELPSEYKANLVKLAVPGIDKFPQADQAKVFDETIDLPFAMITTIAEKAGYTPEHGSWQANLMEIGNLLVPVAAHKIGTSVGDRVKSITDLKELTNKVSEQKATPEDFQDLKDISDGMKNLTPEEIKAAAEGKPYETKVLHEDLHSKLAELESKTHEESFALLPEEAQKGILDDMKATQQEIIAKEQETVNMHLNEAASQAKISEINEKIGQLQESLEGQPDAVRESIKKTIEGLKQERNPYEFEQKQKVVEFKIQEAIDAGEIEAGTIQEKMARESLVKKYENAVELEKDSMEMFKADEADIAESFVERSENNGDFVYKSDRNEYTVKRDGRELSILDKDGKEPSPNTKLKIVKDYESKFDYNMGKSAFEGVKEGEVLFEEADKLVAERSENPAEIIEAHERLMSEKGFEQGDAIDNIISENIGKVKQKGKSGYNSFGDQNNVTDSKARAYFNEGKGEPIDTLAQRLSEESGLDVTVQDIISFIDRHPNGISDYTKSLKNPLLLSLKNRFKDVTGLSLNERVLRTYAEKALSQAELALIDKSYESAEQARESFWGGIESGKIKEPNVSAEVADISAGEKGEGGSRRTEVSESVPQGKLGEVIEGSRRNEEVAVELRRGSEKAQGDGGKGEGGGSKDNRILENKKQLKLGERILDSSEISPEIKAGLKEKGIDYIPVDLDLTQSQAKEYVKAFVEAEHLDKAIANVTDMSNKMPGVVRGAIGKELFEVLADRSKQAENLAEQKKWQDKAVDIARFTAENFKAAGQEINAAKAWKRMLERTPEGAIASIKKGISEKNEGALKAHKEDISSAKELIDEFIKSDEFGKIVGEKVQKELERLGKRSPKKENIFNSKKVRDTRLEELRERAKKAKDSGASSSIVGLNKEQIEIYGEMGVIYLIEGAYKFKTWANKMKKENPEFTENQLEELWNKSKVGKEYDPQGRTLSEFAKYGVFEVMPPEAKKAFLDKWEKKLTRLSPESRKKLLGNALDEIQKLGGLSNERFKEMYAKELGLPGVDIIAEAKIRTLIDVINKSDKTAKELQDLFDKGADKKEIAAKQKQWMNEVFEGQKANAELSDYFKNDKRIGSTLSTILQGNLLGPLSLVKNIYSNSLIQPLRMLSRGISSSADFVMSKAAMLPLMDKMIKQGRTIDALAYWKGESKGVMPGLKTSVKELIRGINPEEMIERDLSQQLQPLKSMVDFYAGLKGEKKISAYQQINNFAEATFGVPAEVMFRLLNLGDKPFRKAAEYGAAYEIGSLKGLKGKELEKFVLFPDAASAELIKKRSESAVYQQSEGLSKVAQQGLKSVENYLSDLPYVGDIAKVVFKSQIPYVKTPLNILGETLQYTFPKYTTAKAIYHGIKGERRQSLEYSGKAVVGAGIRYGVSQLIQNNLVTGSNDRKDVEGSAIQFQNVPPNSLNITGLQRMLAGGSTKIMDNDVWVNYNNMGVVGLLIGVHANQKDTPDIGYLEGLSGDIAYTAKAGIEQSFLSGANTFLEALTGDEKSKRKWAINTLGALGAIFYPNTFTNISKAKDDTSRVTKADLFSDELANTFKTKMFTGHQLPSKVNLWGETIKQVPEGDNKYVWYLLDVTKGKAVDTDSFNYKIYDLWESVDKETKSAVLPNIPRNYLTIKKEKVILSPTMYETYQKYVGKNRASLVEKYTQSPEWKKDSQEKKIEKLKRLYESGANNAKKKLLQEHPELKPKK